MAAGHPLSSSPGNFSGRCDLGGTCVCVWGGGGIPNWTYRQISEKKERTRLLTEDVICITPLLLEPELRFYKA